MFTSSFRVHETSIYILLTTLCTYQLVNITLRTRPVPFTRMKIRARTESLTQEVFGVGNSERVLSDAAPCPYLHVDCLDTGRRCELVEDCGVTCAGCCRRRYSEGRHAGQQLPRGRVEEPLAQVLHRQVHREEAIYDNTVTTSTGHVWTVIVCYS